MSFVFEIINFIIGLLGRLLPALSVPSEFIKGLDSVISFLIEVLQIASFLIPLDILIMCFGVIFLVDNFALFSRVSQFIIGIIRG